MADLRVLIYWAMGGVSGISRLYAMAARALRDCGYLVDILSVGGLDPVEVRRMHGVDLGDVGLIKVNGLSCGHMACGVVNSRLGVLELAEIAKYYDAVYLDELHLGPATRSLSRHGGLIYYIHGFTDRVRPIVPISKPHRMLLMAALVIGSDYGILRRARVVFANSRITAHVAYRTFGIRPIVLHPPVDVDFISRFRGSDREDSIVSLGRLGSAKGHELAVRVLAELRNRGIRARLYVMGYAPDAPSMAYARSLAELARELGVGDDVAIVPNPTIEQIYGILGRSKAMIHAKPHEPFGIVVVEAMAAGAVPVVHRSGGPWHDIVYYGKYGLGYTTVKEAADAVEYVLRGGFEEYSKIVVERAREFAVDKYRETLCGVVRRLFEEGPQ